MRLAAADTDGHHWLVPLVRLDVSPAPGHGDHLLALRDQVTVLPVRQT